MLHSVSARWPLLRTTLLLLMISVLMPALLAEPTKTAPTDAVRIDKQIIDEAKDHSEIITNLTYLSDMIGPRLTGSANLRKANDWTAEKMKEYGLSNVHLEGCTIPVGWERGKATMRVIEPDIHRSLSVASMGWSPGTKGKVEGDVVILKAKNSEELAKYKGKLKNSVVLQGELRQIPGVAQRDLFGGGRQQKRDEKGNVKSNGKQKQDTSAFPRNQRDWQAMMTFRREMADFLRSEGVACMLMDSGKPHELLNMTGSWRGNDRAEAREPIPQLFITHEGYALLYRLASRPAPAKTRVEFEIENKFTDGPVAVYNTVGEIPGTDKADEFVVIGAHLDSWDLGQGTTDNGTGSCVVLETARILSKLGIKPRRTIRFILFTGEEQGLYGSQEYVKKHKDEMAKTSMALVHDTGTGKVTGFYLQGRPAVQPILERELVSLKELGVTQYEMNPMNGTDHASFDRVGVPGFAFRQDPAEYRFTHHSQSDTLDKANEDDLKQGAQAMAVAAVRIANLPEMLPRDKPPQENGRGRNRGDTPATPKKEKSTAEKQPVEKK